MTDYCVKKAKELHSIINATGGPFKDMSHEAVIYSQSLGDGIDEYLACLLSMIIQPDEKYYSKKSIDQLAKAKLTLKKFFESDEYTKPVVDNSVVPLEDGSKTTYYPIPYLIENPKEMPFPIDVIPNNMGIGLGNVEDISVMKRPDGQLKKVSINFTPANKPDLREQCNVAQDKEIVCKSI